MEDNLDLNVNSKNDIEENDSNIINPFEPTLMHKKFDAYEWFKVIFSFFLKKKKPEKILNN